MNEIIQKSHKFEKAKNQLKEFSRQYPENFDFEKVETDFLLFFDHKVTGEELNNTITKVQRHLMTLKTKQIQLIEEFHEVYNALDILDKDYIQKILIAIKMATKAIEKAEESYDKIEISQNDMKKSQNDIKTIIEKQKITINALINFKENILFKIGEIHKKLDELYKFKFKIENYKHLSDIDSIWNTMTNLSLSDIETKKQLKDLYNFKSKLGSYKHLSDIDKLWEELQSLIRISNESKEQIEIILKFFIEIEEKIQNNTGKVQLIEEKLEMISGKNKNLGIFTSLTFLIGIGELIFILWRCL